MDALFVRVPNLKDNEYLDLWGAVTPDSLLVLTSYLQASGIDCRILDFYADPELIQLPDPADLEDRIELLAELVANAIGLERPLALGFTTLSNGEASIAVDVARRVKARFPRLPVLLGGYFATNNSRAVLESCPFIDAVVTGEGERPTLEILTRLKQGGDPFHESVADVAYRRNGTVVEHRSGRTFDLKTAPPLDYGLLDRPGVYQTLAYHTSRGCPWRCNYCLEVTMGTTYRTKPHEVVREDISAFKALNPDFFLLLTDPMLAVSDRRLVEVCEVLADLDVAFLFETRVDVLSPERIPLVKQAGCNSIYFGFESASFDTLLRMNKLRPPDYDQYQRYLRGAEELVAACARHRVTPLIGVMVGYPGDTPADLTCSLDFIRRLRALYVDNVGDRDEGAGFVVSPSEVYIPRSSATWDAQPFFSKKGLTVFGNDLFGDYKVRSASAYLDHDEILQVCTALRSLSINPQETLYHQSAPTKKGNMAATLAAKVTR